MGNEKAVVNSDQAMSTLNDAGIVFDEHIMQVFRYERRQTCVGKSCN